MTFEATRAEATPFSPLTHEGYGALDLATRRRAEILCGTIKVIARDGLSAAKLKDIALESGVSLGLIQHYFDTRERLVDAAFAVMMRIISRGNSRHMSTVRDPLQFIYEAIHLHVFGTVSFPERWGFWSELWSASGRSVRVQEVAREIYQIWGSPIEAAMQQLSDQGRLPAGSDPEQLTAGLLALMDGLAIRSLSEPERFTAKLMLRILNDWTTVQLGADTEEVAEILERVNAEPTERPPMTLTPAVVAATLLDAPSS